MNRYWKDEVIVFPREDPFRLLTVRVGVRHLDGFSRRLLVTLPLLDPDERGMRKNSEVGTIRPVIDSCCDELESAGAVFVGQRIQDGGINLSFYLQPAHEEHLKACLGTIEWGQYAKTTEWFDDEGWEFFNEHLHPTAWESRRASNFAVVRQLRELGDDPDLERMIDHVAIFPPPTVSQEVSQQRSAPDFAEEALTGAGFRVERNGPDDDQILLEFRRVDRLGDGNHPSGRIDQVTKEIFDLLSSVDFSYDGWGCPVTKHSQRRFLDRLRRTKPDR